MAIGPLLFSSERFAAIVGIAAFWLASGLAGRFVDRRISVWGWQALIFGLIGARLGHVTKNWQSFAAEPWRILYVWQGGFSLIGALLVVALLAALRIRSARVFGAAAASTALGIATWAVVLQLSLSDATTPLPAFALERLDGGAEALTAHQGEPMVVNLWATWCPPCLRELPLLARAAAESPGVTFAFVNQGDDGPAIRNYLAQHGIVLADAYLDPTWQISTHYQALGLPTTLFVDADGRVAASHVGEISPEQLADRLAELRD
ncbi:MAG: TlpA family protein disulfide reductase [Devosia sp.]